MTLPREAAYYLLDTCSDDHRSVTNGRMASGDTHTDRDAYTLRKTVSVILGLTFYLAEGLNYGQLGPFFPVAAEKKGVSLALVGITTGVFDFANLIASLILGSCITPRTTKFFFVLGGFISGICVFAFGCLGVIQDPIIFISLCILTRILMGLGAAMIWTSGVPLIVPLYPSLSGRITSLVETGIGVGIMVGPPMGSLIYSFGGYPAPFLMTGTFEIILSFVCIFVLPAGDKHITESQNETRDPEHMTFTWFFTRPGVLITSLPVIAISTVFGYLDVALSPYLETTFGVEGDTAGYYFLAFGGVYALASPPIGYLVDKGQAGRIFAGCTLVSGILFFLMFLPNFIPYLVDRVWLIVLLLVQGFACSGGFVPVYLIYEKYALHYGYQSQGNINVLVASLINVCFTSGRIIGPMFVGGIYMEYMGYYQSTLLEGGLILFTAILGFVALAKFGLLRSIYYNSTKRKEGYEPIESSAEKSGALSHPPRPSTPIHRP